MSCLRHIGPSTCDSFVLQGRPHHKGPTPTTRYSDAIVTPSSSSSTFGVPHRHVFVYDAAKPHSLTSGGPQHHGGWCKQLGPISGWVLCMCVALGHLVRVQN
jgi:hypothetical protein